MWLDVIVLLMMATAIFKGYSRGLIVAVFSFVALVVGVAAALKLSKVAVYYLHQHFGITSPYAPLLCFIAVFIIAVALVRLGAKFVEGAVKMAMLGWVNRLGGIIFYVLLYALLVSIGIFYAEKLNIVTPATAAQSRAYPLLQPWGSTIMNLLGTIIPWFSQMFDQLAEWFEQVSDKIPEKQPT